MNTATVFPNPFTDGVSLNLQLSRPVEKMLVSLVDAKGRVMVRQELVNMPAGTSVQQLNFNSNLPGGTYYMLIQGMPNGKNVTLPLLKMSR